MQLPRTLAASALLACALSPLAAADTIQVDQVGFDFTPQHVVVDLGDTVVWVHSGGMHTVTEGTDGTIDGNEAFHSPLDGGTPTFQVTFDAAFLAANPRPGDRYDYFCEPHFLIGMVGSVTVRQEVGLARCFCDAANAPCSNPDPAAGCENSTGAGALLGAVGSASIADQATNPVVLRVTGARPNKNCVWIQGGSLVRIVFKDGNLCAGNPTIRLPGFGCAPFPIGTLDSAGAISTEDPVFGFDVVDAALCKGDDIAAAAPTTREYQLWFRDGMGPCGTGSNLTNAVEIVWVP